MGARCYNIHIMKSLSHKNKYSAMQFARQNATVECVLYAKVGVLGEHQTTPRILKEGSYGYLDCVVSLNGWSRSKTNIVTKSFFENVLTKR